VSGTNAAPAHGASQNSAALATTKSAMKRQPSRWIGIFNGSPGCVSAHLAHRGGKEKGRRELAALVPSDGNVP
jgi:hypothetical protein